MVQARNGNRCMCNDTSSGPSLIAKGRIEERLPLRWRKSHNRFNRAANLPNLQADPTQPSLCCQLHMHSDPNRRQRLENIISAHTIPKREMALFCFEVPTSSCCCGGPCRFWAELTGHKAVNHDINNTNHPTVTLIK
jgi:hypothetical protein